MSQENVEKLRTFAEEDIVARAGGEFDAKAAIARQAELWDPEIELDASEFPALDISGVHRGACVGARRESSSRPQKALGSLRSETG